MENYELLHTALIYDRIPISQYVSRRTGLTVLVAEVEGPIINVAFHIITEAFDDNGVANALKHMIFMGSEDFPYKDIPNLIATSCLGSEITAQIESTHTTYTIQTAISDVLLHVLPIIGDYILFPLLTEEAFMTEVHHVTEDGEDAGIVYKDLCSNKYPSLPLILSKNVYLGKCSYASNILGTVESLRESVTVAKGPKSPFVKPFQTLPPPLSESKDITIKCLARDNTTGQLYMAWRTVSCITDSYTLLGITMLLEYLTDSPASPLLNEFIKNDDGFTGRLEYGTIENKESCVYVCITNVPIDKLSEIKPRLQEVFKNIIENRNIDMKCLQTIITQFKLKEIINLENYSSHLIQSMLIRYMAFGSSKDHCVNPLPDLDKLLGEPQSFWLDLLQTYIIQNKSIVLQCLPKSKKEEDDAAEIEKGRIEAQKQNLTQAELKENGEMLKKAMALKERRPPPQLLISVPLPNIESIKLQSIKRFNSDSNHNHRIDLSETPVFTYFDHVNASTVFAFLGTSDVPAHLQNYLLLLFECLMDLPIERNGVIIPYEEALKQLEADTIYKWTHGRSYSMPHLAAVCLEVEISKYEIGLCWLREILYKSVFTVDRVKSVATRLHNELRKGCNLDYLHHAINAMCFSKDIYLVTCGELHQNIFLTNVIEKLGSNDGKEVLDNIEKVRTIITEPSKVTLYIAANLDRLQDPVESINVFMPPEMRPSEKKQKLNSMFNYEFLQFDDSSNGVIIGNNSDHSVSYQVTKTMTSYVDPDYAALTVYLEYIGHDDGPLRKQLQGMIFWLRMDMEDGLLYFNVSRANNVIEAYEKARKAITIQLETSEWDEVLVKGAKRSTLLELIEEESTIMDVILSSRKAYLHNLDYTYRRQLFDSVAKVTIEDLRRVGKKYVIPLFDPRKSKIAILAHTSQIMKLSDDFKKLGWDLTVYKSLKDSFLNLKKSCEP